MPVPPPTLQGRGVYNKVTPQIDCGLKK